jgi:hypothetical protein
MPNAARGLSEPRVATAPAGVNGGARGGDGASKRRNNGSDMPKSRKTQTPKPARKTARKSAKPASKQQATKAASSRSSRARSSAAPVRPSKKAAIVALLERPNGAAIGDLIEATGWQTHSVRAALTGLRKEGKELVRDKDAAGVTHYRLAAA